MFEMNLYAIIFYALGILVLVSTFLAITRSDLVKSVLFLILAFIGTAGLFFILGAPLLAALEVIIYAGAFMVLFLFIIMTRPSEREKTPGSGWVRLWAPGLGLAGAVMVAAFILLGLDSSFQAPLPRAWASPGVFGRVLFEKHWLAVEIASLLLFAGLVGGLYLGRAGHDAQAENKGAPS